MNLQKLMERERAKLQTAFKKWGLPADHFAAYCAGGHDAAAGQETPVALQHQVYAWLGYWRDKMPPEAVVALQDALGPLAHPASQPTPLCGKCGRFHVEGQCPAAPTSTAGADAVAEALHAAEQKQSCNKNDPALVLAAEVRRLQAEVARLRSAGGPPE